MKKEFDLYLAARLFSMLIIAAAAGIAFAAVITMERENIGKQADRLQEVIKKAAIKCYALEGAFPEDIYYLRHYGVVFDNENFYFRYEMNGISNYMPDIYVIPR